MGEKMNRNSCFNLSSIDKFPVFNQSLKMINTVQFFPLNSQDLNEGQQLGMPEGDDSLGELISLVQTAANSGKKKKIGCNCKKTYCLKMYCECFSNSKKCGEDCGCVGCKNTTQHQEVIRKAKQSIKQGGLRSCSLSDKRCNCKKSHCLKRYCECFTSGIGCSPACHCESCENRGNNESSKQESQEEAEKEQALVDIASIAFQNSEEQLERFYS